MTNVEELEEAVRPAPWVPRVITGGKGPPEPPTVNWLAEYEAGTTFVTRSRRSNDVDLNLYHVRFKSLPDVMLLIWQLPDGKMLDYYVDPMRFSKQFEPGVILGVLKDGSEAALEEEATEVDGGNDDTGKCNTRGLPDMVLHEAVPGECQLPEEAE